jgi:hypothetical protein
MNDPGPPSGLDVLLDAHADALSVQPFLERHPALLEGLVPDGADHAMLRDGRGRQIALAPGFRHPVHLLALSGGHPLTLFGVWDGRFFLPLSVWHERRLHNVDTDFIA